MLSHLCRLCFWFAALAAALALVAPPQPGTWLTALAFAAVVLAWALWRVGLAQQRQASPGEATHRIADLDEPALLEIALRLARTVEAASSFDAALLDVGRVLKSELGLHDVRALRVECDTPDCAALAELVDGRVPFCAAPRRVRLDPSSTLGRALLDGGVVVGPEGGSALPVRVAGRTVAVLELGAPAIALKGAALAGLLGLAQWPLSRRGSHAVPGVAGADGAETRSGYVLHDNGGLTPPAARAMPIPASDLHAVPQSPDATRGGGTPAGRLDPSALARLAELDPRNENQLVRRVLTAFAASAARLMPQFEAARSGPDLNALRYVAHTLKSSSASIGATALSATCAEVESRVRSASGADGLAPRLDVLSAQVAEVLAEIDVLLGAPS
ncbi:MAG: Hpt domain-containing protein [Burkholderiaceae bacterium]